MELPITTATSSPPVHHEWMNDNALPLHIETSPLTEFSQIDLDNDTGKCDAEGEHHKEGYEEVPDHTPKEFAMGAWLDPSNDSHGHGKRHQAIYTAIDVVAQGEANLEHTESAFVVLADDELANYREAINSPDSEQWKASMKKEYNTLMGYNTWELVEKPPNTNIVSCRWTYHVKCDNLRQTNELKSQLIAQGFFQIPGLDFEQHIHQQSASPPFDSYLPSHVIITSNSNISTLKGRASTEYWKTTSIWSSPRASLNQDKSTWSVS